MANKWLKHVRYSIGFANLIFLFSGAALIGIGAWIFSDSKDYFDAVEKGSPYVPAILSIVVGSLAICASFFGCVGAFGKMRSMVMLYIGLLMLILLVQVVMITISFNFKDSVEKNVKDELNNAVKKYDGESALSKSLNKIQENFGCCGVNSYTDWQGTNWYVNQNPAAAQGDKILYPISCCQSQGIADCQKKSDLGNQGGCRVDLKNWTRDRLIVISSVSIALLVIQIFGILIGTVLLRMTPNSEVKQT